MAEQSFEQAVRESRIFYRRELAKRLAVASIRRGFSGDTSKRIVALSDALSKQLFDIEDKELIPTTAPEGAEIRWACVACTEAHPRRHPVTHAWRERCPNEPPLLDDGKP